MFKDEIMALNFEELETRANAIVKETAEADGETLDALNSELDWIEERRSALKAETEKRAAKVAEVAAGAGNVVERSEGETMKKEVRNSKEYLTAYKNYVITGDDTECRALLTENAENGVVPVPEFVESRIRNAWENDKIFSRITKTFIPGNLKVGFEVSATNAWIHPEGETRPAEEVLTLGIVNMVPVMIKKWITVSDEVLALGAEDFLAYLYDEIAYKIVRCASEFAIDAIQGAPAQSTKTEVGVAKIDSAVTAEAILNAIAQLGDNAQNNVIIASGETIAAVRTAALSANYAYDPFFGLEVIQKEDVTGAIVGDLSGVQANLPNGDAVTFKLDDLSLAEWDLVKLVGKLYAAIAVVGPKMFAYITGELGE